MLLTDRDLNCDAIRNREDCTIIEKVNAPTAKQVAVIWVQEDGLAPKVNGIYIYFFNCKYFLGFWVGDRAGQMRVLKSGNPQIDPCCFPLLHPRGTNGYRWFMKKNGRACEVEMQNILDDARENDFREDGSMPIFNELGDDDSMQPHPNEPIDLRGVDSEEMDSNADEDDVVEHAEVVFICS